MTASLVQRIQAGALDGSTDLADLLRLCVALGGESGSVKLREWATTEVKGYESGEDVPAYRVIATPLLADLQSGNRFDTGQQISPLVLPEFARESVGEEVRITSGVSEVASMAHNAKVNGESVTFGPVRGPTLVAYMNQHTVQWPQSLHRLYYKISPASLEGLLDQVRTILVELVAEISAGLPAVDTPPSAELADRAVGVAVYGDNARVQVASTGRGAATAAAVTDSPGASTEVSPVDKSRSVVGAAQEHPFITTVVVVAAVVAAIAGVWALFLA